MLIITRISLITIRMSARWSACVHNTRFVRWPRAHVVRSATSSNMWRPYAAVEQRLHFLSNMRVRVGTPRYEKHLSLAGMCRLAHGGRRATQASNLARERERV